VLTQKGFSAEGSRFVLEMYKAINSGVLAALEPRSQENTTPTSFEKFVEDILAPAYHGLK